jgi:hypothetical protein
MSDIIGFPLPDRPITVDEVDKLHSEAFRDLEGRIDDCAIMARIAFRRARDRGQGRQARKGNVRGVPGRGYVEEAQGGLLRRLARRDAANMSELTPQHVLVDLFNSDDFPVPIPDPEAAAEIVIQRLIDASWRSRPRSWPNHEAPAPITPEA